MELWPCTTVKVFNNMGKKTRTGIGRRTILRLSPTGPRSITAGETNSREQGTGSGIEDDQEGGGEGCACQDANVDTRTPAVKATEGLSLLGAYEDSDEEEELVSQLPPAKIKLNQSADIDSTLANFMAEIDAITTQPTQSTEKSAAEPVAPAQAQAPAPAPGPSATPPHPDHKDQPHTPAQNGQQGIGPGVEFQYDTQYSLAGVGVEMGDWQEVWDENTGCYYYWNTQTNEVAWQLPHYLAHQVLGLQQYIDSSGLPINGCSTPQGSSVYPELSPAVPVTAPIPKSAVTAPIPKSAVTAPITKSAVPAPVPKTEGKKEVMESVVALTCEKEEERGVAASLLAPLIPEEVKEAEEIWRKKVLGLVEEGPDSRQVGEGEGGLGSPPEDTESHSLGTQGSGTQSVESSDAEEEEAEEDTMELELALERKKAELRALEEGDGSAVIDLPCPLQAELRALEEGDGSAEGCSSPCSEHSQDGTQGPLVKKSKWKTAFLRAPSPESNSWGSEKAGRDDMETPDPVHSKAIENAADEPLVETEALGDKTKLRTAPKEDEETADLKFQIGELANTLTSKMEFLGINKKAISNFQLLLLQTETRIADWREGALNGTYLRRRLQEAAEHIKHYELNAAPKGWSCHWDREHRRYFYVNDRTNASQWDFPAQEEEKDCPTPQLSSASQREAKPPSDPPSILTGPPTYLSPAQTGLSSYWNLSQPPLPPNDPPPPVEYPPPPPLPPESPPPPPPPPLSDEGEIEEVEMEDEEGEPPAPGTEEDGSCNSLLIPGTASNKVCESASSPGAPVKTLKRKAVNSGQLHKNVTIGSNAILYSHSSSTVACAAPVSAPAYWSLSAIPPPLPSVETTASPVPAPTILPPPPAVLPSGTTDQLAGKTLSLDKTKKLKKEKQAKKSKTKMPSLVKKWQSIQRELDEEEKSSSSDEDRDQFNSKRIEEWKQNQFVTGKAGKNANFEALPEDWRARLQKKRKVTQTT